MNNMALVTKMTQFYRKIMIFHMNYGYGWLKKIIFIKVIAFQVLEVSFSSNNSNRTHQFCHRRPKFSNFREVMRNNTGENQGLSYL